MRKNSSRSERNFPDKFEDSMPGKQNVAETDGLVNVETLPARRNVRVSRAPSASKRHNPRSFSDMSSSSNPRNRSRLALEEMVDDDDDRPMKPPKRKASNRSTAHNTQEHCLDSLMKQRRSGSSSLPLPTVRAPFAQRQHKINQKSKRRTCFEQEEGDAASKLKWAVGSNPSRQSRSETGGDRSIRSKIESSVDAASTCTLELVLSEQNFVSRGQMVETALVPPRLATIPSASMMNETTNENENDRMDVEFGVMFEDELPETKVNLRHKQQPSSRVQNKRELRISDPMLHNSERLDRGAIQQDNLSRSDSLSTVPDPPSLHQGGHYSIPGAFRMRSGGIQRIDSLISSVRSVNTNSQDQQTPLIEASLVEDIHPDSKIDYECPSPPAPANYTLSVGDMTQMTAVTTTTASPIVEAKPMDDSLAIRVLFRNGKVQVVICMLLFVFIVLVLGTVYGVTGFENVRGIPTQKLQTENPEQTLPPTISGDLDLDYFVNYALPEYARQALRRGNSPQAKALAWLRNNTFLESYSLSRRLQRFSLASFFYSTGGERRWKNKAGWLSDEDECTWYSRSDGPICNKGEYKQLSFISNELRGTFPPEVALLSSLEIIELQRNILSGFLPTTLGDLSGLKEIRLYDNYLSGVVPSEIGNLNRLEVLDVEFNFLAQLLPETLSQLTSLKELLLDRNLLVGDLPSEFGKLSRLETFYVFLNALSGSLPTEFGNLSNLRDVRFEVNFFSGTIPSEIGMWTKIEDLVIGNNTLTGSIPTELGNCQQLTYLDLYRNFLSGSLPTEIGLLTNAGQLYFEENRLSGELPTELGHIKSATRMWIHKNLFTGTLPSEIGLMTKLTDIDLGQNTLSGSLPTEVGLLTDAEFLNLESNLFTGTIPSELGNLSRLTLLALEGNLLTGEMPTEICELTKTGVLSRLNLTVDCSNLACNCCTCVS